MEGGGNAAQGLGASLWHHLQCSDAVTPSCPCSSMPCGCRRPGRQRSRLPPRGFHAPEKLFHARRRSVSAVSAPKPSSGPLALRLLRFTAVTRPPRHDTRNQPVVLLPEHTSPCQVAAPPHAGCAGPRRPSQHFECCKLTAKRKYCLVSKFCLSTVVAHCEVTRIRHSGAHTVRLSAASTAWSAAVSFAAPHAPGNTSSQRAELGEADFAVPACR